MLAKERNDSENKSKIAKIDKLPILCLLYRPTAVDVTQIIGESLHPKNPG